MTLAQTAEVVKAGEGIMHQYGLAVLGLIICVVLIFMFVWGGLKVVVPVANAIATWSGNNAAAAASNATAAEANERISEKLERLMSEMAKLYDMMQTDRRDELVEMGKRGERLSRGD